jgi:hypothetical protein
MAGSISQFKSSFKQDLARPSRFDVQIPVPMALSFYGGTTRQLNYRCENTELPGRTLATTGLKIYNLEEKFPYQTTYNDISMTFIVDEDMRARKFFDAWINYINPTTNLNFKYKTDYAVSILVNQYDMKNVPTYSVYLLDAYPISVNQMDLDWSSDGFHKLVVTFAYTYWKEYSIDSLAMDYIEQNRTNSTLGKDLPPVEDRTPDSKSSMPIGLGT